MEKFNQLYNKILSEADRATFLRSELNQLDDLLSSTKDKKKAKAWSLLKKEFMSKHGSYMSLKDVEILKDWFNKANRIKLGK